VPADAIVGWTTSRFSAKACSSLLQQFGVMAVEWLLKLAFKERREIPERNLLGVMLGPGVRTRRFRSTQPVEQNGRFVPRQADRPRLARRPDVRPCRGDD
jgi:hypothetical protein